MDFKIFFYILIPWVQCLIIDPEAKDELNNLANLQNFNNIKLDLQNELDSLMPPGFQINTTISATDNVNDEDLMILPPNLLSAEVFEKIGLGFLNSGGYTLNLNNNEIRIPQDSKTIFVFNTSNPLSITNTKQFLNLLYQSLPFNLPNNMNLINYFLVLPKSYFEINTSNVHSRGILFGKTIQFPIFRISENKPLLVFMFSNSKIKDYNFYKDTISNIKNYLTFENDLTSTFFDKFAQEWIRIVSYDSLIKSKFCTTNANYVDESFCLQIHDSHSLHLFPAFSNIFQLTKLQQILQRYQPEYYTGDNHKKNFTSVSPYISTETDRFSESQHQPRQCQDESSTMTCETESIRAEIETDKEELIEGPDKNIDDKVDNLFNLQNNQTDKVEPTLSTILAFSSEFVAINDHESNDTHLLDNLCHSNDNFVVTNFESAGKYSQFKQESGLVLPLSLLKTEYKSISPRHRVYSQVINNDQIDGVIKLSKRYSIFSKDPKDCEKITWFNVFRHSVFGKPKFCLYN